MDKTDPSGDDAEASVGASQSLGISSFAIGGLLAAIGPAVSRQSDLGSLSGLPPLPTGQDAQLLVGMIFAESSSKYWPPHGHGENDFEKCEMGLTILNRAYYATKKAPNGRNYNQNFGDGTVLGVVSARGAHGKPEFRAYMGPQWNLVMNGNYLRPLVQLSGLAASDKNHLALSIDAADWCENGASPIPTGFASYGNPPGQFPVAWNKAKNWPPGPRMFWFVHLGDTSFYAFKPGRETK